MICWSCGERLVLGETSTCAGCVAVIEADARASLDEDNPLSHVTPVDAYAGCDLYD